MIEHLVNERDFLDLYQLKQHDSQAHVSYLVSHISLNLSTQFGFVGTRTWPHGIHSGPLFSAQA
jgi:hypothetical protein